jgi:hypothetical protein
MEVSLDFWKESFLVETSEMTEKEMQDVHTQLMKRYLGVLKYLGLR